MNKTGKNIAEHYKWGINCDGWRLVNSPGLSIKHEKMPPGNTEKKHLHLNSKQFFFILEGEASMETEEKTFTLLKE